MNPYYCRRTVLDKLCPGSENNKCCVPTDKQRIYQARIQYMKQGLSYSGRGGVCINVSSCRGKIYGGLCLNSYNDLQCCINMNEKKFIFCW